MRDCRFRIAAQDTAKLRDSLFEIAHLQMREPDVHHRRHVVRIRPQHLFKLLDTLCGIPRFHQEETVVIPRLPIRGIEFDGLAIRRQCPGPVSRFL